jgi:hypothetical protein
MSPKTITVAQLAFLLVTLAMSLVFRTLPAEKPSLIFVVASIAGTNAFAFAHHRFGGVEPTTKDKLLIGASFSLCVVISAIGFALADMPLLMPEVTVPISMIGVAVFPFVLTKMAWKAISAKAAQGSAGKGGGSG